MNEKFLTRGMLEDTKDWVVGYFVESPDNVPGIYDFNGKFNKIIPETAGRYINIDDKEGRRIFEGDIVTAKRADENIVGIVEYDNHIAAYVLNDGEYSYLFSDDIDDGSCKVISNIHDTPVIMPTNPEKNDPGKLKPCPICGGEAKFQIHSNIKMGGDGLGWSYTVVCKTCRLKIYNIYETHVKMNSDGELEFVRDDRRDIISTWNRRYENRNSDTKSENSEMGGGKN